MYNGRFSLMLGTAQSRFSHRGLAVQQLTKSGSTTFHIGWQDVDSEIEVADKRTPGAERAG